MRALRIVIVINLGLLMSGGCATERGRVEAPGPATVAPKYYICHRTDLEIIVDGWLDDRAWQGAPWTDTFSDIEGPAKPAPRYRTRVKMLWDDVYLYVAARLEEPHVWATLTERDAIVFHDNDFEIFIDPNGDAREYYEIEVNALNTIFDLFLERTYLDGGPARHEWNLEGMRSAVAIDGTLNDPSDVDAGWSVEFALPWRALGEWAHRPAPPDLDDVWRMNFSRVQWRHVIKDGRYEKVAGAPEDNWVWSPQGAVNMHLPRRWGCVCFDR